MPIFCPSCGKQSAEGGVTCLNCGFDLRPYLAQAATVLPGPSMDRVLRDFRECSAYGVRTDRNVSLLWLLVPITSLLLGYYAIVSFILIFEAFLASLPPRGTTTAPSSVTPPTFSFGPLSLAEFEGVSLIPTILFLYFIYLLIRRRNLHLERKNRLLFSAQYALKLASSKSNLKQGPYTDLGNIEETLRFSRNRETEKSAVLWAILLIVPFVDVFAYFYVFNFLTNDFYEHESSEDRVLFMMSRVLAGMGIQFSCDREERIDYHSFWIFLFLTLITLGAFSIYWEYLLITGPNKHFKSDTKTEENLAHALSLLPNS